MCHSFIKVKKMDQDQKKIKKQMTIVPGDEADINDNNDDDEKKLLRPTSLTPRRMIWMRILNQMNRKILLKKKTAAMMMMLLNNFSFVRNVHRALAIGSNSLKVKNWSF